MKAHEEAEMEAEVKKERQKGEELAKHIEVVANYVELIGKSPPPKWIRDKWWKKRYQVCPICGGSLTHWHLDQLFGHTHYAKCQKCDYEWAEYYHALQD